MEEARSSGPSFHQHACHLPVKHGHAQHTALIRQRTPQDDHGYRRVLSASGVPTHTHLCEVLGLPRKGLGHRSRLRVFWRGRRPPRHRRRLYRMMVGQSLKLPCAMTPFHATGTFAVMTGPQGFDPVSTCGWHASTTQAIEQAAYLKANAWPKRACTDRAIWSDPYHRHRTAAMHLLHLRDTGSMEAGCTSGSSMLWGGLPTGDSAATRSPVLFLASVRC